MREIDFLRDEALKLISKPNFLPDNFKYVNVV